MSKCCDCTNESSYKMELIYGGGLELSVCSDCVKNFYGIVRIWKPTSMVISSIVRDNPKPLCYFCNGVPLYEMFREISGWAYICADCLSDKFADTLVDLKDPVWLVEIIDISLLEIQPPILEKELEWEESLQITADFINSMLKKKHHDYGEDNLLEWGDLGIIIKLWDKIHRLRNLVKGKENLVGDSIKKEYADIAGYCLQGLLLFHPINDVKEIM